MRSGQWPNCIASLLIVLLVLAVSQFLGRQPPAPVVSPPQEQALRIEYRTIRSPDDIVPITGSWVSPIAYTNVPSFTDLEVKQKKLKFFDMLLPAVLISEYKLSRLHRKIDDSLKKEELDDSDRQWLDEQCDFFGAADYQQLLRKTKTHPVSIVLAQAALESGWGESRFFEQANNVFGVWSFNPAEPRVKAYENREGQEVYVKKYDSLIESVDDYFLTIARGPFLQFRHARQLNDDPTMLVNYLSRYSEQGEEYTRRLLEVIEKNGLRRYDSCRLDPVFYSRQPF